MNENKEYKNKSKILRKAAVICFWLFIWQAAASLLHNDILLSGPSKVAVRLFDDLQTALFYKTVFLSVIRIMGGLFFGISAAVILAICSAKFTLIKEIVTPFVNFIKAVPITCFVVLLLIWAGTENLSFLTATLVAFPPVYLNLLEGLKHLDKNLAEMAYVYGMPWKNRMHYLYLPGVEPYLKSAVLLVSGMVFKAGVAAEIIGTPVFSMGERIYMSKIYLDTEGVLSWMIVILLVSYGCEKFLMKLFECFFHNHHGKNHITAAGRIKKDKALGDVILKDLTMYYGKQQVLNSVTTRFQWGRVYGITGSSGIGKTTLLKVIAGLLKPKEGECSDSGMEKAMVFQENRLLEEYTAIENIFATGNCSLSLEEVSMAMEEILPREELKKPLLKYSGGMKRRVELARAFLSDGNLILLDEPFNGMDDETKERVFDFMEKYRQGRTVLFTTHCLYDIQRVKAEEYRLWTTE